MSVMVYNVQIGNKYYMIETCLGDDLISGFVDGELKKISKEYRRVEEHVQECRNCRLVTDNLRRELKRYGLL